MKIQKLKIDSADAKTYGIKEVELVFNTNMVAIVGKNGSGKTRFLNLIRNYVSTYPTLTNRNNKIVLIDIPLKAKNSRTNPNPPTHFKGLITYISPNNLKNINVQRSNNQNQVQTANFSNTLNTKNKNYFINEYSSINFTALKYFEELATRIVIEQANSINDPSIIFEESESYQKYKSLSEKFESLIEKKLNFKIDSNIRFDKDNSARIKGIWILDGRPFKYIHLSDGEKTLFSYILLLFLIEINNYSNTKDSIILIDEPEIHLHPEAQIKLVQGLKKIIGKSGQIFVATHSLTILSLFNYDQIFMVKANQIYSPSSSRPEQALTELIGDQNRIKYLMNMFSNISSWSLAHFMLNNFNEPEVIKSSKDDDPQFLQFTKTLKEDNIKFLDFGCGKGRLLKLIQTSEVKSKFKRIDAFEPKTDYHSELPKLDGLSEIFSELKNIPSDMYDIILLANVLHEIDLSKIIGSLKAIKRCLKKEGVIVVIEDLILRKGEMPNEKGYFVFNQNELKTLFNSKKDLAVTLPELDHHKERLMCAIISRQNIGSITKPNLEKAIIELKNRSFKQAIKLRQEKGYNEGRTYGFYIQQYMNCEIYLNKNI